MRTFVLLTLLLCAAAVRADTQPAATLRGCGGVAVAFSQDGTEILTAGKDSARVWDGRTFGAITPVLKHGGEIRAAAITSDGKSLMTAGGDHFVRVWDAKTGRGATSINYGGAIWSAAISPDGSMIAIGGADDLVTLWDSHNGTKKREMRAIPHFLGDGDEGKFPSQIAYLAFSPDSGKILAVRRSKGVFVWDARTGKQLAGRDIDRAPAELEEGERSARPAAFSADGKAVASMVFESVVVWDASSGRPIGPPVVPPAPPLGRGVSDWPSVVALAPGGKAVAAAGKYAWVWRVADETVDPVADTLPVRSPRDLVFSPDGKRLLIAARFNDAGVYDAQSGDQVFTIGRDTDEIPIVAYSPDGKYVAAAFPKDDSTTIWPTPAAAGDSN